VNAGRISGGHDLFQGIATRKDDEAWTQFYRLLDN